jgi:hypothetical protein
VAAAPLTFEIAHAIDAPMADYDAWLDALAFGICTACGRDAWSGTTGWWHADGNRLCPERAKLTPTFAADLDD